MRACLAFLFALVLPPAAMACEGFALDDPGIFGGPMCLPQPPERVVVLDSAFGLGIALDVGLSVVGAPLDLMSDAALRERAISAGVQSIGVVTEPSLENIVALQPDLILGFVGSESMAAGVQPMASQLAPTLLYTALDWQNFYRLLAPIGGQETEVAEALATFEARLADIRARIPDIRLSVLRITSWDFQVYMDAPVTYAPFALLQRAGVSRSAYETTNDPNLSLKRPDWEELALLTGDVLFYIVGGTNDSDKDGRHEEVLANPLWQSLTAVQGGRVHRVDHAHWMEFNGLASAHRVLDDLENHLIATP